MSSTREVVILDSECLMNAKTLPLQPGNSQYFLPRVSLLDQAKELYV
jgi:hypothetical protein